MLAPSTTPSGSPPTRSATARRHRAPTAAQRAWLRALEAYPRLRSTSNLRGWLLTITARSAMDAHRARRRRPLPVAAVPDRAAAGDPPGGDEQGLWDEVRRLPDRQRLAL